MSPSYQDLTYSDDFEDCSSFESYDGTGTTCIKGYAKAKADEMLLKGADSCRIEIYDESNNRVVCSNHDDNFSIECSVYKYGDVSCYHDSATNGKISPDGDLPNFIW